MKGFIGEFLGTAIMIILGVGSSAGTNLNKTYAQKSNWNFVTISWGLAVTMGVYVAGALGSLGHLNPAVTIPYAIFGLFPWSQVIPYILGQFAGAFVGAILVLLQFWPHFQATDHNEVGIFATQPAITAPMFNFISEIIATFSFIFILLNLGNFTTGLKPMIVGLVILLVGNSLGTTTGFALNPARDWGPRLVYTLFNIPHKTTANWQYSWMPMLGPIIGSILATALKSCLH